MEKRCRKRVVKRCSVRETVVALCKTPTLLNVFFLILSGWRGCKGNFKKISVPMTLNWYLEDNGRFK